MVVVIECQLSESIGERGQFYAVITIKEVIGNEENSNHKPILNLRRWRPWGQQQKLRNRPETTAAVVIESDQKIALYYTAAKAYRIIYQVLSLCSPRNVVAYCVELIDTIFK